MREIQNRRRKIKANSREFSGGQLVICRPGQWFIVHWDSGEYHLLVRTSFVVKVCDLVVLV